MKLICAEYDSKGRMFPNIIGDNALLRSNNNFYIPYFSEVIHCVPQIVLRASKLGKGISERFAGRYYNEIGTGIRFYAESIENTLKGNNILSNLASSFDESAAISEMQTYEGEDLKYGFLVNDKLIFEGKISEMPVNPEQFVAETSKYFMIKTGDYFFCGNRFTYRNLRRGDRLQMSLGERTIMEFEIK
ncbi:MAG: fumarylacetoacetate hydrolase [Culturomica sp.]|jgi:hypothetical protein|nr:fumarylacetoacetate hydrolase [Culturomica sp.]